MKGLRDFSKEEDFRSKIHFSRLYSGTKQSEREIKNDELKNLSMAMLFLYHCYFMVASMKSEVASGITFNIYFIWLTISMLHSHHFLLHYASTEIW